MENGDSGQEKIEEELDTAKGESGKGWQDREQT